MAFDREVEMYPLISRFFEGRGFRCFHQVRPRYGSEMDVVGLNLQERMVINIEAKLRGFKETFWQARMRKNAVDKSYLAFPLSYAREYVRNREERVASLEDKGFGLLGLVGDQVQLFTRAKCTDFHSRLKRELIHHLIKFEKKVIERLDLFTRFSYDLDEQCDWEECNKWALWMFGHLVTSFFCHEHALEVWKRANPALCDYFYKDEEHGRMRRYSVTKHVREDIRERYRKKKEGKMN